ncbi:DNA cytosine methyltransferase [Bacillus cereus]|nr:DNA cytosine methyltransferase [Bacillus cereus]
MSTLRVFEAFSGIGTQSMALKRLGVDYETVGIAEIDKFAIQSYMAIHGETKNYGDISKIDPTELPDMDLFTYSFPCQDLSISGKQRGMGEGTRSGLLYECEKVVSKKKPKYLLLENVKNLVGKKFKPDFDKWLEWLESQGYSNYWQVLNAKDYGVPQNRERVFVVSVLGDGFYEFPEPFPLEVKLKDILEDEAEEKHYLSSERAEKLMLTEKDNIRFEKNRIIQVTNPTFSQQRVYHSEGIAPTIAAGNNGGGKEPCKIIDYVDGEVRVKEATKLGYKVAEKGDSINLEHPNSTTRRGRVGKQVAQTLTTSPQQATIVAMRGRYNSEGKVEQQLEPRKDNLTNTITTVTKDNLVAEPPEYRIRRLTPLECWRLMGIDDEDFYKAKSAGTSDSQLYKQAGNAIVVDVLVGIFGNLFGKESYLSHTDEIDLNDYTFVYVNELAQQQWRL